MKKEKVTVLIAILIIAVIFLVPVPYHLKDGGTVVYKALLYTVSDVHSLNPDIEAENPYLEGMIIEILGVEVYNNVE